MAIRVDQSGMFLKVSLSDPINLLCRHGLLLFSCQHLVLEVQQTTTTTCHLFLVPVSCWSFPRQLIFCLPQVLDVPLFLFTGISSHSAPQGQSGALAEFILGLWGLLFHGWIHMVEANIEQPNTMDWAEIWMLTLCLEVLNYVTLLLKHILVLSRNWMVQTTMGAYLTLSVRRISIYLINLYSLFTRICKDFI